MSARCSSRAARFACSAACTRPRWRSGSASEASRGMAPSTGMSRAAIASATSRTMPLAADAVQHHPADPHVTLVGGEAAHHGRRRLRLPGDVDDQQHRQAEPRGEVGRRAGPERRRGDAVEQAHGALDDEEVGMRGVLGHQRIDQRRRHGPAVEIEARPPGGRGMKARVDIVGPDLGRLHHDAAPAERRQQRQRQRGLAARPSEARQR